VSETPSRRERRQLERQRRPQRGHGPAPRRPRRIGGIWIGLGVVAIAIVGVLAAQALGVIKTGPPPVDLDQGKYQVGPAEVMGEHLPDEGNGHVGGGQKVSYGSTPPASGSHWGQPAGPVPWGIKDQQLPSEAVVHNMEHGGVVIWYKGLTAEDTSKLKDLVALLRTNGYNKIVLMPYADMQDARVAVSAWRWLLKLPSYDDAPIVKFVKAHYDGPDAPERGLP